MEGDISREEEERKAIEYVFEDYLLRHTVQSEFNVLVLDVPVRAGVSLY